MLIFVTAVAVVLVVSFLCSIFESVLLAITRPQIEKLARDGSHAGTLLAGFKDNIDVPIAGILILNTAAHTIGAAVAGASYSSAFDPGTLWLFSIVFTLAVLLFTEIIPKTLGVSYADVLAVPVAHAIRWLTIVLKPLVFVSEKISRSLRRATPAPVTSAEEIRMMALLGRSQGAVGPKTAGMILGVTQLLNLKAHDILLPREDVRLMSPSMGRDEAVAFIQRTGHSRFPFTPTGDLDDVSGVILVKKLLHWLLMHPGSDIDWDAIIEEALVVHRALPVPRLMNAFEENQKHLAIVVNEYGTVEGIATLEDVLEEIVGDIRDEHDVPYDSFWERPDGTLVVRADADLRAVCARLGLPWQPETAATTLGGLVIGRLEKIPDVGETIDWEGYRVEVLRADSRRVKRLAVRAHDDGRAERS